jgi:hypothetical protein
VSNSIGPAETSQFTWSDSISVNAELEIVSMEAEQSISLSLTNTHGSQYVRSQYGVTLGLIFIPETLIARTISL